LDGEAGKRLGSATGCAQKAADQLVIDTEDDRTHSGFAFTTEVAASGARPGDQPGERQPAKYACDSAVMRRRSCSAALMPGAGISQARCVSLNALAAVSPLVYRV
jgi:hypothetical protein